MAIIERTIELKKLREMSIPFFLIEAWAQDVGTVLIAAEANEEIIKSFSGVSGSGEEKWERWTEISRDGGHYSLLTIPIYEGNLFYAEKDGIISESVSDEIDKKVVGDYLPQLEIKLILEIKEMK